MSVTDRIDTRHHEAPLPGTDQRLLSDGGEAFGHKKACNPRTIEPRTIETGICSAGNLLPRMQIRLSRKPISINHPYPPAIPEGDHNGYDNQTGEVTLTEISLANPWGFFAIAVALALGGILKGATGAGMPIIAVPVIASVFEVQFAVAVLVIPNLLVNLGQMYRYRNHNREFRLSRNFALSGALGAGIGTFILASLPTAALNLLMSAIIFAYIALRLLNPAFHIPLARAQNMVWLAGTGGGILQGALGVSAPIAVTFANAIRLERSAFIFMLSTFFCSMCLVQIPLQISLGLMNWTVALLSIFALVPLGAALPVGEWIGSRMSAVVFDRFILIFLAALATKQFAAALGAG